MEESYHTRSGQIPAFGNWDYTNDLPITQYFDCARQAGLVRSHCSSSSSGECGRPQPHAAGGLSEERHQHRRRRPTAAPLGVPSGKTRVREKRLAHVKEPKKQSRTCDGDLPEPPKEERYVSVTGHDKNRTVNKLQADDAGSVPYPQMPQRRRPPKPVDEDLYKISPDLLRTTKRKKMLGFISRCLAPACSA
ncbi:hypothetical protein BT93_B1715 [Corymbia citriodora subsp. variegata]|nr:hypothetical protein BT93_B1715 [Corymbia citriodora subsp. variegata]